MTDRPPFDLWAALETEAGEVSSLGRRMLYQTGELNSDGAPMWAATFEVRDAIDIRNVSFATVFSEQKGGRYLGMCPIDLRGREHLMPPGALIHISIPIKI